METPGANSLTTDVALGFFAAVTAMFVTLTVLALVAGMFVLAIPFAVGAIIPGVAVVANLA